MQFDPDLVRRRTILGVLFGCLALTLVIVFVLVYFLVLKPKSLNELDKEDHMFQCKS